MLLIEARPAIPVILPLLTCFAERPPHLALLIMRSLGRETKPFLVTLGPEGHDSFRRRHPRGKPAKGEGTPNSSRSSTYSWLRPHPWPYAFSPARSTALRRVGPHVFRHGLDQHLQELAFMFCQVDDLLDDLAGEILKSAIMIL